MEIATLYAIGKHGMEEDKEYAVYNLAEAADLGHKPALRLIERIIKKAADAGQAERIFQDYVKMYDEMSLEELSESETLLVSTLDWKFDFPPAPRRGGTRGKIKRWIAKYGSESAFMIIPIEVSP